MADRAVPPHSFGVTEGARYIGLSRTRVYELIANGEIQSFRVGGRRLILRSVLEAFIAQHRRGRVAWWAVQYGPP